MHYLIRLEHLLFFVISIVMYALNEFSWWVLLMGIFLPDVTMAGYLLNPRMGSIIYNIGHTYVLPLGLLLIYMWLQTPWILQFVLIWLAHISIDRVFGFGLKYPDEFKHTTIQRL